jgi:hypothetical protein
MYKCRHVIFVFFVQNPAAAAAAVLKSQQASARSTDEHDTSYTCSGLYLAFSRHRLTYVCSSSFVANSTKKHKCFGEPFTIDYARLYSSLFLRQCGHVCTRLVREPVNEGVHRLRTLPD